jgi:hypothetical protein
MTKPQVCSRCGQPAVKVAGSVPLIKGLCWWCRRQVKQADCGANQSKGLTSMIELVSRCGGEIA